MQQPGGGSSRQGVEPALHGPAKASAGNGPSAPESRSCPVRSLPRASAWPRGQRGSPCPVTPVRASQRSFRAFSCTKNAPDGAIKVTSRKQRRACGKPCARVQAASLTRARSNARAMAAPASAPLLLASSRGCSLLPGPVQPSLSSSAHAQGARASLSEQDERPQPRGSSPLAGAESWDAPGPEEPG